MTQQEFMARLNATAPQDIMNLPEVKNKYIDVFNKIWKEGGEATYERESRYFRALLGNLISQNQSLATQLDRFSVYNVIVESAITNISLEPGTRALAYLTTRNRKLRDQNGREVWQSVLCFTISGYGEMVARIRCGQIRHADNPVVVYENDELRIRDIDGHKSVEYTCNFPHTGKKIVACYLRITRADGSIDYATMFEEDWQRLATYSDRQNRKSNDSRAAGQAANALYSSVNGGIDPGFLMAKIIKHAFRTYPKVKIGAMAVIANDQEDDDYMQQALQNEASSEQFQESAPVPQAPWMEQEEEVQVQAQQPQNNDDDIF